MLDLLRKYRSISQIMIAMVGAVMLCILVFAGVITWSFMNYVQPIVLLVGIFAILITVAACMNHRDKGFLPRRKVYGEGGCTPTPSKWTLKQSDPDHPRFHQSILDD